MARLVDAARYEEALGYWAADCEGAVNVTELQKMRAKFESMGVTVEQWLVVVDELRAAKHKDLAVLVVEDPFGGGGRQLMERVDGRWLIRCYDTGWYESGEGGIS